MLSKFLSDKSVYSPDTRPSLHVRVSGFARLVQGWKGKWRAQQKSYRQNFSYTTGITTAWCTGADILSL